MAAALTETRTQCPACGKKAKRVSAVTVCALLNQEYADEITAAESHACCASDEAATGWRFCDFQNCDVVYFAEQDETTFTKPQLKVVVGVKETTGERPLCYCFDHSVATIKEELRSSGKSTALEDIRAKMIDPRCRCETENPSGSCCLGSVGKGIKAAQSELVVSDSSVSAVAQDEPVAARFIPARNRGELIAKVGTVISAVMASACCWLPLVLLAVGVSGAGIASTLEAYRPVFIVVTFGFLGAAFYFTYRPKKEADAGSDCCAPETTAKEDCCAPTMKRRFNMNALNKVMLWVVTVLAVAFLFFPSYVGALFGSSNEAAVTEDMNWAVFKIEGMTCEGCSATVGQAIRGVPSVQAVSVSYEKREAVVGVNPGSPIPKAKILVALQKAGYTGSFVQESQRQAPPSKPTANTEATE